MTNCRRAGSDCSLSLLGMLLVFLGAVEFLTIILSRFGITILPGTAAGIMLTALALAGVYYWWLGYRNKRCPEAPRTQLQPLWISIGLLLVAGIVYLLLWIVAYAVADYSFDGLWYHLPPMHFWSWRGGVHWITAHPSSFWEPHINNCFNGFPKGIELFTYILVQATGVNRLLNSLNLPFLPLGILAIFCLCRFLGASVHFALPSALLFLFVPVNIAQSPTSLVDTASACCYSALFAILAFTLETISEGSLPWKLLPALGAALGLAIGAKIPGLVLLPLSVVLLVGSCLMAGHSALRPNQGRERGEDCRSPRSPRGIFTPSAAFGFILLTILLAVAVGGYWPARNYLRTSNPINPVGLTIAGKAIFPDLAWDGQFHAPYAPGTEDWPQIKRILYNWLEGPRHWRLSPVTYHSLRGGLGLLWILGCVPALLYLVTLFIRKYLGGSIACSTLRRVWIFSVLGLLAVILFFAMPPHHNHIARYTIWLYGWGLPCFALAAEKLWRHHYRPLRLGARIWITIATSLMLLEGMTTLNNQLKLVFRCRNQSEISSGLLPCFIRSLRDKYPTGYQEGSLMNAVFQTNDPVALGPLPGSGRLLLGRLVQGDSFGRRKIFFLDPATAGRQPELKQYLQEHRIRFVIWHPESGIPPPLKKLSLLQEFAPGGYYLLVFNVDLLPESY